MEKRKNIISFIVKMLIWAVIQVIIWNIPPVGALTEAGIHTIAVFVGLIFGMIFIKQYGVYMLGAIFLMAFTGAYSEMNASLIAAFGNTTFVMIFSISLLSGIIVVSGLAKTLAKKMINAKFAAGKPWMLTFVILATGTVLSLFIHPLVIIVIMADLIIEIYRGLGLKYNRWTLFVLGDMACLAIQAQTVFPFQVAPSLVFGLLSAYDPAFALSNWAGENILIQFALLVLMFAFAMLMTYLFCRNHVEELKTYKPSDEKYPLTADMKRALWILVVYVVLQLLPLVLPNGALKSFISMPNITGYSVLAAAVACALFKKDGENFITFDDIAANLNWYILLMLAALGSVTGPLTSDSTGILQWLTDILTPICQSVGTYGAFAILIVVIFILTNLTDNIAIIFLMVPLIYVICPVVGLNTVFVTIVAHAAVEYGIVLPSSTPHIALVFAKEDTGYIKRSALTGWMLTRAAFALVIFLTIGWAFSAMF